MIELKLHRYLVYEKTYLKNSKINYPTVIKVYVYLLACFTSIIPQVYAVMEYTGEPIQLYETMSSAGTLKTYNHIAALVSQTKTIIVYGLLFHVYQC